MSDSIECPECRKLETRVVDSRPSYERGSIRRRRECLRLRLPLVDLRGRRGSAGATGGPASSKEEGAEVLRPDPRPASELPHSDQPSPTFDAEVARSAAIFAAVIAHLADEGDARVAAHKLRRGCGVTVSPSPESSLHAYRHRVPRRSSGSPELC